jgi:hypothetical protein
VRHVRSEDASALKVSGRSIWNPVSGILSTDKFDSEYTVK